MPQLSLAYNFFRTLSALIVNKDRFGPQRSVSKALSLFLILTLLTQVLIMAPVGNARAATITPPPQSLGIGPQPAFAKSLTGGLLNISVIGALILPNVPSMLIRPEAPDPFLVPRGPTFGDRLFANAVSLLGLIVPKKIEAENGSPMKPELNTGPATVTAVGAVKFDFDGDGKTDIGRFNAATNPQFRIKGSGGNFINFPLGSSTSVIAPGDYDGDGVTDPAVVNGGTWTYIGSSDQTSHTITLGETGIPMAGDYNGDGNTDAAVFDPSSGDWHVRFTGSSTTELPHHFGQAGDIPVSGDFDRDGTTDFAVFRPGDGNWYCDKFDQGYVHWGQDGDIPLQGDFDADQISDLVIYRPSTGTWYVATSSTGYNDHLPPQVWGNYADQPVPGDYNGDGVTDHAVWRPSSGDWHILESIYWGGEGKPAYVTHNLGASGDVAVPSAYTKQIGGTVTGYDMAGVRLDPSNATGETNLYSQNFSWGTSLVSLPGRSGLDAGFGISYNSLVWAKVGSAMVFDPDNSNVSPGFRFGFPVIEPVYYDSGKGRWAYMMVAPDGGRVEFRQLGASGTFETADSSYTQLVAAVPGNPYAPVNGPVEDIVITVTTTDGTQVRYNWKGGAFRCDRVMDRNGNYITVNHNTNGLLTSVTDTLGRVINVSYDTADAPISITQTWKADNGEGSNQTHTWASFSYTTLAVDTNFDSSLTVFGPPNTTVLKVLDKITFADGSNTRFLYNSYAQVHRVENYAPDNHKLNHASTDLWQIPSSPQTDCPRVTERYSWAQNFNGVNGVPYQTQVTATAPVSGSYSSPEGSVPAKVVKVWTVGHPDQLYSKIYFGNSGWNDGLQIATEDCLGDPNETTCSDQKRWTWTKWDQDRWDETYAAYTINPRIVETRVGDGTNTKRSTISYVMDQMILGNVAIFGLVHEVKVFDQSTEWKKSVTTYNLNSAYVTRRIIGLPESIETYGRDSGGATVPLVSKVTYGYDEGNLTGTDPVQNISPVQHDNSNYGAGFNTGRGNLTSTTRWDVSNQTSTVMSRIQYNTAGSPVSQKDAMDRVTKISYTDDWIDLVNRSTFAYPTTVTDPGNNSSTVKYRYDIGANVWATSPAPVGQSIGKTTSRVYNDTTGRVTKEKVDNTGAYTRYVYAESGNAMTGYSTIVDVGGDERIGGRSFNSDIV